jgi:hypothetical protein
MPKGEERRVRSGPMNRRGTRRAGPGLSPIQGAALSVRVCHGAPKGPQCRISLEPNDRKFLSRTDSGFERLRRDFKRTQGASAAGSQRRQSGGRATRISRSGCRFWMKRPRTTNSRRQDQIAIHECYEVVIPDTFFTFLAVVCRGRRRCNSIGHNGG